jgi:hypothetical protein
VTYISRATGEAVESDNRRMLWYFAFAANVQLLFFLSLFKSELAGHRHIQYLEPSQMEMGKLIIGSPRSP